MTTKILKLELSEKDYVGCTVGLVSALYTEYALKKSRKVSKINGLGSFGFLCLIKQKQIHQINNQVPFCNSVPSFSLLVVYSLFLSVPFSQRNSFYLLASTDFIKTE